MKKITIALLTGLMLSLLIGCGSTSGSEKDGIKDALQGLKEAAQAQQESTEEPEDAAEEPEADLEESPEEEQKASGVAPRLILHRNSQYDWGDDSVPRIKHEFTFVTLEEKQADGNKGLAESLTDAMNEIITKEQEAWDHDLETIAEQPGFVFDESWKTYVRRADGEVVSLLNEYVTEGQFDSGFYSSYIAHSYHTEGGKEIAFSEVVKDEEKFFDVIVPKVADYVNYAATNIYAIELDMDPEKIRADLKDYLKEGVCAWTLDPQGVTLWVEGYTMLQSPVCATVLFSEDTNGEIFADEFRKNAPSEWIMQVPVNVETTCDIDDSGKEVYVAAHESWDFRNVEESDELYLRGLYVSCDGSGETFEPTMPGGTSFYDAFLIHRSHQTVLLENHDEYDRYFMETFSLNADGVNMVDSVCAGLALSEDETYRYLDTYSPCYIPTDPDRIAIEVNAGLEDAQYDHMSVDENGRLSAEKIDIHGDIDGE